MNAEVRGELRIVALDAAGRPLEGFDAKDCAPIHGDSLAHAVRWRRHLAALRGRPVQLKFRLRDTRLYGFALEG